MISLLTPYDIHSSKIRLGPQSDGGYVLPSIMVEASTSLVTYGVAADTRFEQDYCQQYNKPAYLFDHTVDCPPLLPNMSFRKEGLGININGCDDFLVHYKQLGLEGNVLLKLDIEGGEYAYFEQVDVHELAQITTGIIFEVHYLEQNQNKTWFSKLLKKLDDYYVVSHVHGNTYGGIHSYLGENIPNVLEITLVNRKLISDFELSTDTYPTPGLDFSNSELTDYSLNWLTEFSNKRIANLKLAFFHDPFWSIGSLNNQIAKHIAPDAVSLNWREPQQPGYIQNLVNDGYTFVTAGPGLIGLAVSYGVPFNQIHVICHDEDDICHTMKACQHVGLNFDKVLLQVKGIAVPSHYMVYHLMNVAKTSRVPDRVRYGFNVDSWEFKPRNKIEFIGGCGSNRFCNTTHQDCKRFYLLEELSRQTGIPYEITRGQVADIKTWYGKVDLNIVCGLFEGGPLSPFEAAACGIPTFGTSAGSWSEMAFAGAGHVVPTADKKYLAETIRLIKYYNSNPSSYEELSYKVREEVLKYDWKHVIYDWLDFFENPSTDLNPTI